MLDKKKQENEVILEYIYKPFGHLKIASEQLIFDKIHLGINTFTGVIDIKDLENVKYLKGAPFFGVPGLEISYKLPNKESKKIRIYFPSSVTRLVWKLRFGVTPVVVYETIVSLQGGIK
jgi:hypothetical protein